MAVIYQGVWGIIPPWVTLHHHGDTCVCSKVHHRCSAPCKGSTHVHTLMPRSARKSGIGDNSANCCKQQMKNLNASSKNEEENDWNGISSHVTPTDRVICGFNIIHQLTDASVKFYPAAILFYQTLRKWMHGIQRSNSSSFDTFLWLCPQLQYHNR